MSEEIHREAFRVPLKKKLTRTNTEHTKIARESFLHERNRTNTELRGAGSLWGPLWPCGIEEEAVALVRWREMSS